jgi:ribonuclease G
MNANKKTFSQKRKTSMRFKPSSSGKPPKNVGPLALNQLDDPEREMVSDTVFDARHEAEILKAENKSAGVKEEPPAPAPAPRKKPAKEPYKPVPLPEPKPRNFVESVKGVANKMIETFQRMMGPVPTSHKEIIINAESLETRVAVLENGRLEDFTIERSDDERLVGSIYKGRVQNLEDGLKAAFVDIGFDRNAFLHYWDIIPNNFDSSIEVVERSPRRKEKPRITQNDIPKLYPIGSEIVVQVTKGAIGTKGPRVTTNISLPGKFLVLLPNSDQSGISRKIDSPAERERLKKILRELDLPEGMGVIIRTAGEEQQKRYFIRDLAILLGEWRQVQESIRSSSTPSCVFQEPDLIGRMTRDFLTEGVERIVIDNQRECDRAKEVISRISKRSAFKVKLYADSQPIFDRFNITRQISSAFARRVYLKSGGYIVIDETEALVAIDVNSGGHKQGSDHHESTILRVNLEAAEEICRQLRLRNIGGLIILDFIDMKMQRDRQAVYNKMKEGLRRDRARTHILPISSLGLMEMTRQRHTESVLEAVYDDCKYCKGRGMVKSALTMSVEIQRKLSEIFRRRGRDESDFQLKVVVHPLVLDRLRTEDEQLLIDMEKKYYGKLSFRADPAFHAEEFKIYNSLTNEELEHTGV